MIKFEGCSRAEFHKRPRARSKILPRARALVKNRPPATAGPLAGRANLAATFEQLALLQLQLPRAATRVLIPRGTPVVIPSTPSSEPQPQGYCGPRSFFRASPRVFRKQVVNRRFARKVAAYSG